MHQVRCKCQLAPGPGRISAITSPLRTGVFIPCSVSEKRPFTSIRERNRTLPLYEKFPPHLIGRPTVSVPSGHLSAWKIGSGTSLYMT